ncbi:hypothetical protein DSM3645_22581 [Blastopirellula marina DSM 3645]|uniref:Uncharacterized protein n=1 Tax=Blastopirellula marina DSM 3645 TaxID=314230 RepID=A3ZPV3_9BACT|nr:hypothetical protein DSM3645_22581 [Blastopirellula marina DSM 3645]
MISEECDSAEQNDLRSPLGQS